MKRILKWGAHLAMAALLSVFIFVRLTTVFEVAPSVLIAISVGASLLAGFILLATDALIKWAQPFQNWWVNALVFAGLFCLGLWWEPTAFLLREGTFLHHTYLVGIARVAGGAIFGWLGMMGLSAMMHLHAKAPKGMGTFWVILLCCNIGGALYVGASSTVYFWDNAGFFEMAKALSRMPFAAAMFFKIGQSVLWADYNELLAFPISLLMRVFGTGRMVFVLAIINLYLAPGYYVLWCTMKRVVGHSRIFMAVAVLLSPCVFYMAWNGFVDVAAMSLGTMAVLLWMDQKRDSVFRGIACGLLILGCILLRRTFLFFSAAFGVAAFVSALLFDRRQIRGVIWMGVVCLAGGVLFLQPLLAEKIVGGNYREAYSAYAFGVAKDYFLFARYFGLLVLGGTVLMTIFFICRKETRENAAFLALNAFICFGTFVSVQTHGQQHLLLYIPALYGLIFLAAKTYDAKLADPKISPAAEPQEKKNPWGSVVRTQQKTSMPRGKQVVFGLCGAAAIATAFSPFIPREQPQNLAQIHSHAILPSFSYQAPVRSDMQELIALQNRLDHLSTDKTVTVGVVASSLVINSDLLSNVAWSANLWRNEEDSHTQFCYMGDVDKRDGFSWGVLDADYLVVASPAQTHLQPENQRVIVYLAEEVLKGQGVGKAYQKLPDNYSLKDGVSVYIYKRTRAVLPAEKRELEQKFLSAYPNQYDLFAMPK